MLGPNIWASSMLMGGSPPSDGLVHDPWAPYLGPKVVSSALDASRMLPRTTDARAMIRHIIVALRKTIRNLITFFMTRAFRNWLQIHQSTRDARVTALQKRDTEMGTSS